MAEPVYDPDRELSLDSLIPERLTFHDTAYGGDGSRHEWCAPDDLGLEHAGQLRRIQEELAAATRLMVSADTSAEDMEQAAAKLGKGLDALFVLLLPTLPPERLRAIPVRAKQYMIQWWKSRQPIPEAPFPLDRPAGPSTPRGRRLRDSSPPTA